jgi:iron complex transport system substrate-binding protein
MDPSIKDLVAPRSVSGQVNVEELIVADPQLVIAGDLDGSLVEKKTRIPVAFLKSDMNQSAEMLKQEIRFYGMVFGKQARAENTSGIFRRPSNKCRSAPKTFPKTNARSYSTDTALITWSLWAAIRSCSGR